MAQKEAIVVIVLTLLLHVLFVLDLPSYLANSQYAVSQVIMQYQRERRNFPPTFPAVRNSGRLVPDAVSHDSNIALDPDIRDRSHLGR